MNEGAPPGKIGAYLSLAAAMGIAGSSVVTAKVLACRFPVFLAGGCSLGAASIALLPAAWRGRGNLRLRRRDVAVIALQALTGIFLFRVLLMYGLRRASAVEAGLMTSSLPAVTALIAFAARLEKPTPAKAAGILLSAAGLAVTQIPGASPAAGGGNIPAIILVFAAVICEAVFTVLQKKIPPAVPPLASTALVCIWGCGWFLPLAACEAFHFAGPAGPADVLFLAYYGLVVTALAFFLFYQGARRVPASTAGAFKGLMPLSGLILSHFVLGEAILLRHAASLALVLAGIAVMERAGARSG